MLVAIKRSLATWQGTLFHVILELLNITLGSGGTGTPGQEVCLEIGGFGSHRKPSEAKLCLEWTQDTTWFILGS